MPFEKESEPVATPSLAHLWSAGARWRPSTAAASCCTSTAAAGSCCRRRPWGPCRTSPGCTSRWTWLGAASRRPSSCPGSVCPPQACRASLHRGDYQDDFKISSMRQVPFYLSWRLQTRGAKRRIVTQLLSDLLGYGSFPGGQVSIHCDDFAVLTQPGCRPLSEGEGPPTIP